MSEDVPVTETGEATRRSVIGMMGLGLSAPLLSACGGDGDSGGSAGGSPKPTADGSAGGSGGTTSSGGIATTSEIPVGGGKIFAGEKVVITQPTEGEFKAFTAVCTHQGCVVSKVTDDEIDCGCHGSRFSVDDGSVLGGPATRPLQELQVQVEGDQLTVS